MIAPNCAELRRNCAELRGVLLLQPRLLLEEAPLHRRHRLLVLALEVGAVGRALVELLLERRLLLLELGQLAQLRLHRVELRAQPPLDLLEVDLLRLHLRRRLLPLLLALLREDLALLVDRPLQRLDQLVLPLRVAPQERDDLQRVRLALVLLRLERLVLAPEVLAPQLVLLERAFAGLQLDALDVVGDHGGAAARYKALSAAVLREQQSLGHRTVRLRDRRGVAPRALRLHALLPRL